MPVDSLVTTPRVRAGGTVLSLLANPLSTPILRAHLEDPLRLPDLRERIGGAPQTTLRSQVSQLREIGALGRRVVGGMPYTVENELTDVGLGILAVADVLEAWLARAPQGPIALGSRPAKGAIRALVAGWGSTILRALGARELSLTELDRVIPDLSYPSIERRLSAMRAARQVTVLSENASAKPYAVTEWTRRAIGPLVAAGRCECNHLGEFTEPLTRIDVEAGFLLSVPLLSLPQSRAGSCLLAVDTGSSPDVEADRRVTGVHVEVERGRVVSCESRLRQTPGTWALGTVEAWVAAIVDDDVSQLRFGGQRPRLAAEIASRLHAALI